MPIMALRRINYYAVESLKTAACMVSCDPPAICMHTMTTPIATLYGIPNCDKVKQARQWLEVHGIGYRWHDMRKDGLTTAQVQHWLQAVGTEAVINRRGTTWRQLDTAVRNMLEKKVDAQLLTMHPTLIRRPVLEHKRKVHVGFNTEHYQKIFS